MSHPLTLLTPHAMPLTPRVDGRTFGQLTAADIAHALAGTSNASADLLRAKHCHDVKAARRTLSKVQGLLLHKAPDHLSLARLVVEAFISPTLCSACEGHGQVAHGELLTPCHACNGSGIGRMSDATCAARLHVSTQHFRSRLLKPFADALNVLAEWERLGQGQVMDALQ